MDVILLSLQLIRNNLFKSRDFFFTFFADNINPRNPIPKAGSCVFEIQNWSFSKRPGLELNTLTRPVLASLRQCCEVIEIQVIEIHI